ncbi:Gfo/Idh/MocA family oxidoreductase [Pelagibacterales bacterium SAG-MED22]|nr:Gfo/Idh/MocA family oxidoreductase [Pelagibacterales bacterium SAG-MED22]
MKKINISIVGTGLMGLQHIKAISKSKKANLHSIVDISDNAKKLSNEYKIPLYSDVSSLLKSNQLDAVIVATPNQLHEKHTISFLKKKIPVLLEKPISDNIKSAKKIIISSKKNKTPLLIGYHRRHNAIISKVKTIIRSGKLGNIVSANVLCWLYKHEEYFKESWRTSRGGGPLGINLVHDIDMICYLLGSISYVQAFTTNKNRKFKVEDTATVSLIFESGALCTLNISDTIVAPWSYELTAGENPAYPVTNQSAYMIGGTKGSIQFPNLKYWFYKKERSWWNKIFLKSDINKKDDNTLVNQIDHFSDVVLKKVKPKVNGNDGLNSLKIFAAITKSAKTGKKIKI